MSNKESLTLKEKLYRLAAVGALGSVALTGCASNVDAQPTPSETSVSIETPEPTPSATAEAWGGIEPGLEGEALTTAFEIPAGLSDEELAQAFVDRMNAWTMYGATPELASEFYSDTTRGSDEFQAEFAQIATNNKDAITSALFTPEALGPDRDTALLDYMRDVNASSLYLYVLTSSGFEPDDIEPYVRWRDITNVENVTPTDAESGERIIRVTYLEKANVDQNRADDLGASAPVQGDEGYYQIVVTPEDGVERISLVTSYSLEG